MSKCTYIRSYIRMYVHNNNNCHIAMLHQNTPIVNCVKLTLFLILILAPDLVNNLTASVSPFSDAMCS